MRPLFPLLVALGLLLAPDRTTIAQTEPKGTQYHYQYFRGETQVGIVTIAVEESAETLIVRDALVVYENEIEILVQTEVTYRRTGSALQVQSASVTVAGGEPQKILLSGNLEFSAGKISEVYRLPEEQKSIEKTHAHGGEPFVLWTGLPALASHLLGREGEITVFFPLVPRGLRGPVLENTRAIYRLARSDDPSGVVRFQIRATRVDQKREATALSKDGVVQELSLPPDFRLVLSSAHICKKWRRARSKED